jgi:hypothetical protein
VAKSQKAAAEVFLNIAYDHKFERLFLAFISRWIVAAKTFGENAAEVYSLIGTAKLDGIDRESYLRMFRRVSHITEHAINRIDELLPWNLA